ncbi:hypothetical protein ACFP3U_17780 [Kitasatospora misakiensis]|uniref:Uncharacterized protein n=1 Tax=Kitasatospora misakiensis TaxID=67330 RepID=A0ABW0X2Q1_9ACTN
MTLDSRFRSRRFEAAWPRQIIKTELDRLIEACEAPSFHVTNWGDECELFLLEAFTSSEPLDEFRSIQEHARSGFIDLQDKSTSISRRDWIKKLSTGVDAFPIPTPRLPYWSERRTAPQTPSLTDLPTTARRFAAVFDKLASTGYFSWAFGELCVDDDYEGTLGPNPAKTIHQELGRDGLWPLFGHIKDYSLDDLCDIIEYLADQVRRPKRRTLHGHAGCGYHYQHSYSADRGLEIYRWQVNQVLSQSALGLTLTENGRLETAASGPIEDLVTTVRAAENVHDADGMELEHALTQFRARGASEMDRRLAVVALAGILERRRGLIKEQLQSKDGGALFQIANQFGIRHQDAKQQKDYDPELYLEWVFYWYVATINLTNRIVASQS